MHVWALRDALAALLLLLLPGLPPAVLAAGGTAGVNATHIVIGQTVALSGLQTAVGLRLSAGLRTAFAEANTVGGVQSRTLTLQTLDDGYLAANATANFATLQNQTLLLTGTYGSAINAALLPLLVQANMPNVGPYTGAMATRFPFHAQVINAQASFTDNMVVQARLLVERLRVQRIGCLYQNDAFGQTALSGILAALTYVGMQLAVAAPYPSGSLAIEPAVEAIAAQSPPVQAVVLASLEDQSVKFLQLFAPDNRTDPDCVFFLLSTAVSASFPNRTDRRLWPNLYFTHVVPPLDTPGFSLVSDFQSAAAVYMSPDLVDHLSFQAYVIGRLIVQVLRGIPGDITRQSFLDELYNTRLYALGGVLVGMYSRNFSGCDQVVCDSSIGLRSIFSATLNLNTGAMHYNASLGYYSFSVTELSYPVTNIVRPLLFGQLLPTDDPVWQQVGEAIGQQLQSAFASLNAAGGVDGRPVQLLQRYYSGDATAAAAALANRYPLLAFVGSVVDQSSTLQPYAAAQIGTYQTDPPASPAAYNHTEVEVQASLALELMALAAFACKLGAPIHLRAPATAAGQIVLQAMVASLHTQQQQPASSLAFATTAEALEGLGEGTVIAVGSDTDVAAWFSALADLPQLRLLVPSPRALHLRGSLNVAEYPQASHLHYPSMFGPSGLSATPGPEVNDARLYGALLGNVLTTVLGKSGNSSIPYSTTPQVLSALYGSQYTSNGVTLGPYYATGCSGNNAATACECNEGVRQVTVLTATRQEQPVPFAYAMATCRVVYQSLIVPPDAGLWYVGVIVGVVAALALLGLVGWWLVRRGQRDNSAAPKNGAERFCILFTDIQASTYLWATIPDIMAITLHTHHTMIRKLLARYRLYEVKTIGDSFMCAGNDPTDAVDFALALQRELFEHDWGTDRIDTAYLLQQHGKGRWSGVSRAGWNGLRVRVGIHYGQGEIYLDPVSKGYDYYGTVVNTAARVEAVCHGGQVGITQAVHDAMKGEFPGASVTHLGEQILRGLSEPVHLWQLLPTELNSRTFPPLRLEYSATVEVEGRPTSEYHSKMSLSRSRIMHASEAPSSPLSHRSKSGRSGTRRTGAPSTAWTGANNWAESHAMVRTGQLTVQDLTVRYLTVLKALATLLETQTQRVREATVRAICERLHVHNAGTEGPHLEETLTGIVQRVLPSALNAVGPSGRRRGSAESRGSTDLGKSCLPDTLGMCSLVSESQSPYGLEEPGADL
eukprot:EG_transcript_192